MHFYLILFVFSTSWLMGSEPDHWQGDHYNQNSSLQEQWAFSFLRHIPLKGDEHVLDIGCGDGKITARIAEKLSGGSVLGADVSQSMIQFANEHFHYPNLSFSVQNAEKLPYENAFDVLFSFTALHWVQNQEAFLQGAYRALKDTGTLAIKMPLSLCTTFEQALQETMSSPKWVDYFHDFSTGWIFVLEEEYAQQEEEYARLLHAQHFIPTRYIIFVQRDLFSSRERFEQFVAQWLPHLRFLPENLKGAFLTDAMDRYVELEEIQPGEEIPFYLRLLEVIAKKDVVE